MTPPTRQRLGTIAVAAACFLLGDSASQLWQHHVAGWYLFIGAILLVLVRSFL